MYTILKHERNLFYGIRLRVLVVILMVLNTSLLNICAQSLDVYYKSDKAYVDARVYGLNSACKNDKFGFVNTKGKFIIPPVFDKVEEFQNDLSVVKYANKWGMIDLHGSTVIEPVYGNEPDMYFWSNASNVLRCDIFGNGSKQEKFAVLYFKDDTHDVIRIRGHRMFGKNHLIVVGEADQTMKNKGGYGESYMINAKGDLYKFDSMSSVNAAGIVAVKMSGSWYVINLNNGDVSGMPSGCEFYQSLKTGVVFERDRGFNFTYVYINHFGGGFATLDSSMKSPQEKIEEELTFVSYIDNNSKSCYAVLLNSNNQIIDYGVESYRMIGNAYARGLYELRRLDGTSIIIRKNGTQITDYPIVSHELVDNFIKVKVRHEGERYIDSKFGYGVLDMDGDELLSPVLTDKDVVIKNNAFLACGISCLNGNVVFASSDGWNRELKRNDVRGIRKATSEFARKSVSLGTTIEPTPFVFAQNHFYVKPNFEHTYKAVKEETFDGVTYEQPLLGYFEGYEDDVYVIARRNENHIPYLKIKGSEFNLNELWKRMYGKGGVTSLSITPSRGQDVMEAIYGAQTTLTFLCFSYLSNGKAIIKLESSEVVDTDTYISAGVWHSLGKSAQKHLENVSAARARNIENTKQSFLVILDINQSQIDKILLLDSAYDSRYKQDYDLYISKGDFYLFNTSYLARFNNAGDLMWEYNGTGADHLYGFDVNDSNVVISGFNTTEKYDGQPNPLITLLDKESGQVIKRNVESYKIDGVVNPFWPHVTFVEDGCLLQRNCYKYGQDYLKNGYCPLHSDIREYNQLSDVRFITKFIEL